MPAAAPEWKRRDYVPATISTADDEEKYLRETVARDALEASRRLTLPQKPEDYKLELTKNFKAPQGVEFTPDENDPLLPQARAFAQKHGLSQDAFSELLDIHAAGQVGSEQMVNNAKAAEVAKLGATGTARKTAVDTFVAAMPGVSAEDAKVFSSFMFSAKQVEVMEKVMAAFRTQGGGVFTHTGREPPAENGKIEGYDNMSFEQKRHAQERLAGRAR